MANYFNVSLDELVGGISVPKNVNFDKQKLLKIYNELNLSGKERLMQYSEDLVCSGNYKKTETENNLA